MEVSVQKCESSDFPKKPRSVDLKSIYAEKPRDLNRKSSAQKASKGLRRKKTSPFEIRRSISNGSRRKRSRKEASLSSLGPLITKKGKNGLNLSRLKPDEFSSGVGKPEKLNNNSSLGNGLQNFGSDSALDNGIRRIGSSSGLSDGIVIPKKPRGILRQRKIENTDSTKTTNDDCNGISGSSFDPTTNEFVELSTDVVSHSQVLEGQSKKKYADVKNELLTGVVSSSGVSDVKGKKKSTNIKNELSTDVDSPSHLSDGKRKKKSTDVKNEPSSDFAPLSYISDGKKKKKKKSSQMKNDSSADAASPSQMPDGKRKKKEKSARDSSMHKNGEKDHMCRKKDSTELVREDQPENESPLADDVKESYGDFLEDDLEQNAARMLSSRFDPSCTDFGSKGPTLSKPANGSYCSFKASVPESSSVDAAGRMLRPRRRNGRSLVRKRRHFYEVSPRDVDPYCILKQRIRVFWPLDKSWYFGLVKEYDPVTRLHHVKYDDRDEEWINLQNERFKLLLFPSELSGKPDSGKSQLELEQEEGDKKGLDDKFASCAESEPIIAWLTRSKHRRKLCAANVIKKRRNDNLKDFKSSISLELHGSSGLDPSSSFSKLNATTSNAIGIKSISNFKKTELPFVYSRKKFHKRREGFDKTLAQDSIHGSSAAFINILASVADRADVLEELDLRGSSMEYKQVRLKLSLRNFCIPDLVFGAEGSLCHALFLIQFCKLTNVWPMVHMEIVFVDNVLGLRLFLFEVSLRTAGMLLCLIIRSFCRHSKESKLDEMQMPFTSIGINLSGLHGKGGKILFLLYRFSEIKRSKWTNLEDELKRHCMTMMEVPVLECTSSTIKRFCNESCHMLCTSTYKNSVSLENFPKRSNSDILHQIIPNKRFYLKMNPTVCYIYENIRQLPAVSPYFVTAPSFILSLHIKSLIQNNKAPISFLKHNSSSYQESPDSCDKLTINGCSPSEDPSEQVSDITMENLGSSLGQVTASSRKPSIHHIKVDTDALSVSNDGDSTRSSDNSLRNEVDLSRNFVDQRDMELNGSEETVARTERFPSHTGLWQDADKSSSSFHEGYSSPDKSEGGCNSSMNDINVHAQSVGQIEEQPIEKGTLAEESALDLAWESNGHSIHSNPTAPRSARHCNGRSLVSPKYGQLWQEDFSKNGFVHGSKKPRTQVSYSLPFGGYDLGWKRRSQQRKPRSHKKISTDNAKRLSGVSANSPSCHRPLACNANVLVTVGDKGWRESGAQVVLESDDHKDCRICVKFSGVTKYAYKAQHILQPGITNRHTHAMMWKGGKDWALEFTDRSQWSLFKEIHEECYNRNMRAAYVKNIPIPGVRLIADDDCDNLVGVHYVRSSSKYHRQVGTEVDMALDPAHVLYDMDSDDEEWVLNMRNSVDMKEDDISEMTDDMFERVMDIFEKFAYAQECDEFSNDEIEEFMDDVGPLNIVKTIYGYWHEKRLKKGMALIRHFQPALWVRYQQQLKEWESAMSKVHSLPDVSREKECPIKKPPMFAFCLRPRGLEVPHKLLKQRSHKKLISTSSYNAFGREQDGFYSSGRRDDRAFTNIPHYESSDSYHSNEGSERFQYPELHRSNSKKRGSFSSPRDSHIMPFSQNKKLKKNGMDQFGSSGIYEPANMSQIQRDGLRRHRADIDEFKLRDASNAAQHALNMAKMKREKAQWLMHKADLAVHKATVALMIAEVMKESKEEEEEELSDEDDI